MPLSIQTDRLRLRPWRDTDAEPLRELLAERDPRARHRIDADGHPTVGELRRDFETRRLETARTGLALLAIERLGSPEFLGYCGLIVGQASEAEPEIAYELLRRAHHHGYATEAARAVVAAADAAGWTRLWSTVREWNTASRRVMTKIGFVEAGRVDHDSLRGDSIWYTRDRP
jgi:RimJ/RimL family protein N-acetyltransferase